MKYLCCILSKRLIVILGPTASGKTTLSIALAKHLNTEIISADSRQFYREMAIGTAKPSDEEQDGVKHHFIDSHSIEEVFSAGEFEQAALGVLDTIFKTNDDAICVGGSGMYIDALCEGLDDIPRDLTIRTELNSFVQENGLETLKEELKNKDREFYNQIDLNNPQRLIRAIEVIRITGKKYSELRRKQHKKRPFEIVKFGISHDREILYDRINRRVDIMVQEGLFLEVESLIKHRGHNALNTVGYKEIFDYLDGKFTKEEAIELIKRNTRRYAKRQLTWFRKDPSIIWLDEGQDVMKMLK